MWLPAGNVGGQAVVSAGVSDSSPVSGQVIQLSLTLEDEIDFYAAEAEITFDIELMEFVSVMCGELAGGGLELAGGLGEGRIGASVSRTAPLTAVAGGTFMVLEFKVRSYAAEGMTGLIISSLLVYDSSGLPVDVESLSPVSIEIMGAITDIRLQIPALSVIDEGDHFYVDASIFASGIIDEKRVMCEMGISTLDSDPAGWGVDQWQAMDFAGFDNGNMMNFIGEIAFMLPPGEWFITLRASLDGGNWVYGGVAGIWDENDSPSASLVIQPRPPFRYTLAKWDFDNESLMPSRAIFHNMEATVKLFGASMSGFSTGASGLAANSTGWGSDPGNTKYWLVEISTNGLVSLELSSKQYGSGTGPRDYAVQYSLDGIQWHPVEGGEIMVGTNWSSGRLDRLSLPRVLEDREMVFLRWIMTSDISIGEETVGSSGTNRIDDILITGVNPNPHFTEVYPGDTNNDGVVNADDVLPLGLYWLSSGPAALWENTGFAARTVEQWIPSGATFADTNGDGMVDHRDLLAVGLNFGKATGNINKDSAAPLSTLAVDPLEGERIKQIILLSGEETAIRGVAFSVDLEGIPADKWEIRNVFPAFAENELVDDIIYFGSAVDNGFEAALVMKGRGDDITGRILTGFELIIDEAWDETFSINLRRLSVSSASSAGERLGSGELIFSGGLSSSGLTGITDCKTTLNQNFPNPFDGKTSIPLSLNSASLVRLDIADMNGRIIASPFLGFLEKGTHEIIFDGNFLPPGVYLCRMTTHEGLTGVIRMLKTMN